MQGRKPAPFDVLFWNADTTRMAAALHRDMVLMGLRNALVTPGGVSMLGSPVDLSKITCGRIRHRRHRRPHLPVAGDLSQRRDCWAARTTGTCCPPAVTSPRWSTRRATPKPPSAPRRSTPTDARRVDGIGAEVQRLMVAGPRGLAERPQRPGGRRSENAWRGGASAARPRSGSYVMEPTTK